VQGVSQIKVSDDVATLPFTTFGDTRSKPKEKKTVLLNPANNQFTNCAV
jgi:hypothetical protein